jgi:hypothetical protein
VREPRQLSDACQSLAGFVQAGLIGQMWLPQAIGDHHWKLQIQSAGVRIGDGALGLKWQVATPRVIGLVRIPVLKVSFRFAGVDDAQRYAFMRRFDLYMQRGGG